MGFGTILVCKWTSIRHWRGDFKRLKKKIIFLLGFNFRFYYQEEGDRESDLIKHFTRPDLESQIWKICKIIPLKGSTSFSGHLRSSGFFKFFLNRLRIATSLGSMALNTTARSSGRFDFFGAPVYLADFFGKFQQISHVSGEI
jgi:hypothetical protein